MFLQSSIKKGLFGEPAQQGKREGLLVCIEDVQD
jgi:hypothetical protein